MYDDRAFAGHYTDVQSISHKQYTDVLRSDVSLESLQTHPGFTVSANFICTETVSRTSSSTTNWHSAAGSFVSGLGEKVVYL